MTRAAACFLSVDGRDPPDELLQRFDGHRPPVRAGSAFRAGNGLKFRIDKIVWKDDDTVEVEGGCYEGGESSSGNTYQLRRDKGPWRVTDDKMNWIS